MSGPKVRGARRPNKRGKSAPRPVTVLDEAEEIEEPVARSGAGPALTGGDVDADWERAASSGEEAVGGSVATPDQDVVDEIGHALGVEQAPDSPVRTSEEILRARDRHYWHLEREAAREEAP